MHRHRVSGAGRISHCAEVDASASQMLAVGGGIMSLIKSELFTNHALQRPYVWFRNVLFAHEMEKKPFSTTICLSELDPIVPSDAVREHVLQHRKERKAEGLESQVEVKVLPGATHGSFVFEKDYQRSVVGMIQDIVESL